MLNVHIGYLDIFYDLVLFPIIYIFSTGFEDILYIIYSRHKYFTGYNYYK